MTDRKTGATPEQIEAAALSIANEFGISVQSAKRYSGWMSVNLVPDTHRIVNVDDLRALYDWAFCGSRILTRDEAGEYLTHDERGIADRIEALIGDER